MAEEKKSKEKYILGEVATQTQPVIVDTTEKEQSKATMSMEQAIIKILNSVEEIRNLVG